MQKKTKNELSPAQKAILDSFLNLEAGSAKKSDYLNLRKLSKSKKYLFLASPLLAQYEREVNHKPLNSLITVAPYLFIEKESCNELIENIKTYYSELKEYKKTPEGDTPRLIVPINAEVNINCTWHCIEAGRALITLGLYNNAIRIFDNIGSDTSDFSRVMAAEAAGDVFAMQREWNRADEWYRSALDFYKAWRNAPAEDIPDDEFNKLIQVGPSVEAMLENSIVLRIKLKRDEAKRLVDMNYYGPGYYGY